MIWDMAVYGYTPSEALVGNLLSFGLGAAIGYSARRAAQGVSQALRTTDIPRLPAPGEFGLKGSIILTQNDLNAHGIEWGGYRGYAYVTTQETADALRYAPTIEEINHRLGTSFKEGVPLTRVDIDDLTPYNPRVPSELTPGNEQYIPGGLTKGGQPERVIDPINLNEHTILDDFFEWVGQ